MKRIGVSPFVSAMIRLVRKERIFSVAVLERVNAARSSFTSSEYLKIHNCHSTSRRFIYTVGGTIIQFQSATIVARVYSTVTLFARFLGWSTLQPLLTAMW